MPRRFSPPWSAERIPGGYVVRDATGHALAFVYARDPHQYRQAAGTPATSGHWAAASACPLCATSRHQARGKRTLMARHRLLDLATAILPKEVRAEKERLQRLRRIR
jgi:hypothetical protein